MEGGSEVGWGGGRGRAWWGDLEWVFGGGSVKGRRWKKRGSIIYFFCTVWEVVLAQVYNQSILFQILLKNKPTNPYIRIHIG